MKFRPQIILSIIVVIFLAYFIYEAREWRLQARLYPLAIGIPVLLLALVQVVFDFLGIGAKKSSDDTPMDFQFTQTTDSALTKRRTLNIFSWIFGFVIGIWLLGFSVAIPAMVFLYLKVQSREGWLLSLVLTGFAWLFLWGLFERLLRLPFPEAQLRTWLGL